MARAQLPTQPVSCSTLLCGQLILQPTDQVTNLVDFLKNQVEVGRLEQMEVGLHSG